MRTGVVSVVILPLSTDERPMPGPELTDRIRNFITERCPPNIDLVIVPPEYVRIDIEAEVVVATPEAASDVAEAATVMLSSFLHPCTGYKGTGWDFGRLPRNSDIYQQLETIPGVEHVSMLRIIPRPSRADAEKTNRFMLYYGQPTVNVRVGDLYGA
jgi:hypothetical protein